MSVVPDWARIDTVLLDMDGTLLDLHFDTYFWLQHVPLRYAEKHSISHAAAQERLIARYRAAEGTLDWYCVDYWTEQLELDIPVLKQEVDHLISVRPDVIPFLEALKGDSKRRVLVTNAHGKSLALKMQKTPIGQHLDAVVCAHDVGLAKEEPEFWHRLHDRIGFHRENTLLIDDSLKVLKSADDYGIEHLRAILKPDSQSPPVEVDHYLRIDRFLDILP